MVKETMKAKLFESMLELETMASKKTYDNRDYFEQAEGAYKMLSILGIGAEYIRWSEKKTWNRTTKSVEEVEG